MTGNASDPTISTVVPHDSAAVSAPSNQDMRRAIRHELLTPVNQIIGYGEMLLEDAEDDATSHSELTAIVSAGRQLFTLVSTNLDQAARSDLSADLTVLSEQLAAPLQQIILICEHLLADNATQGRSTADLQKIAAAARHMLTLLQVGIATLDNTATTSLSAAAGVAERVPIGAQSRGHLLVVDDNSTNRDMLTRRLERLGYTVDQACDGRAALEMIRAQSFDLVLLDIMMPVMDGYQTLEQIKADPQLHHLPVIVLSALDEVESVVRCIELGAEDYLPKSFDPVILNARISACLDKKRNHDREHAYLQQIEREKKRADDLLHVIIPIGIALSSEKNFNRLLEKIMLEAKALCNADGGSLYLRTDDDRLTFVIARTDSLHIAMGGSSGTDIPFAPLRLYDEVTGAPNMHYVVTSTALTGQSINIHDAYAAEGFDFSGTKAFDQQTGYRTTSLLNVPLKDNNGRVIGVLQLLNALDPSSGQVIPFDPGQQQMIESLSSLASVALEAYAREQRLRQQIEELRIEVDEVRRNREVAAITETSYFQDLQAQARELRAAQAGNSAASGGARPATVAARVRAARRESPLQRQVYTINGQEIVVREQGPASQRLALLIHGWSSSWYALSPLLPMLSERYRCMAVDLPGYGESPPGPGRATIAGYADLLAGLIKQVSDRPAILVGHSMGGMISLTLALRHPALLERMVLLCPTISGRLSLFINMFVSPITMLERFSLANRIVAWVEPQFLGITDRLMKPASFAERSGIQEQDYQKLRADARRPGQGRVRAECYRAMCDGDLRGRLSQIKVPSLVLWGMEDNTVPLRDASAVADEWSDAELRVIPKAGHWPQFETPDVTQRYMRAFLNTPLKLLKVQF